MGQADGLSRIEVRRYVVSRCCGGARKPEFMRVHAANYGVYGARKVWLALDRDGIAVARCTVGRLMAELVLTGAVRGQARCIAIADPTAPRPADSCSGGSPRRRPTGCGFS